MKSKFTILLLAFMSNTFCKVDSKKNDDMFKMLLLANILGSEIKFTLQDTSTQTRSASEIMALPAEFKNNAYQLHSVPVEDYGLEISVFLVWKSPSQGGVAHGKETIENADKVLLDIGATLFGEKASSKMAFRFGRWDIFKSLYGWSEDRNGPTRIMSIDQAWKDPSYDRLGLVIHSITYLFDKSKFKDPIHKMVKIKLKEHTNNSEASSTANQSYEQYITNVKLKMMEHPYLPTSPDILNMETPCETLNPTEPDIIKTNQHIFCGMNNQAILAVDAATGAALPDDGMISSAYYQMYNNGQIDLSTPAKMDAFNTAINSFPTQLSVYDLPTSAPPATVYTTTMDAYQTDAWKKQRLLVLPIPNTESRRSKMEIVMDKNESFRFLSDFGVETYEPIPAPKYKYQFNGVDQYASVSLDTDWMASQGVYYTNWQKTPTANSQINPAGGKNFGYFLPKFSVTVE